MSALIENETAGGGSPTMQAWWRVPKWAWDQWRAQQHLRHVFRVAHRTAEPEAPRGSDHTSMEA